MPAYPSRTRQTLRRKLLRAGIWVFLIVFAASIAGVALVTVVH